MYAQTPPVAPALIAEVKGHIADFTARNHEGGTRDWTLILDRLEGRTGMSDAAIAAWLARSRQFGWQDGIQTLPKVQAALAALAAVPEQQQQPVTLPEVTVAAGNAVTEGGDAVFTFTADPAPGADLSVGVTVAASGDYGIAGASRTVTIPTAGSFTLTLATTGDTADEPDGTVTVTVNDGAGYTVGASASGTVAVRDDDEPLPEVTIAAGDAVTEGGDAVFTLTASPLPASPLAVSVTVTTTGDYGIAGASRTVTIPTAGSFTLTLATTGDAADEPDGSVTVTVNDGAGYTVGSIAARTVAVRDDDEPAPEVATATATGVDAGLIAEVKGHIARFTARSHGAGVRDWGLVLDRLEGRAGGMSDAAIAAWLERAKRYGWQDGIQTLPKVQAALAALAAVPQQQPVILPEVSVAAGASPVNEGGDAVFTLTASPPPASPLAVSVTVATSGDYGITGGSRTVTIPTGGSFTLTLPTYGDNTDEPDGTVTVTVVDGAGYTVGPIKARTVAVRDIDEPLQPKVKIRTTAQSVTEGGDAVFTLTASPPPESPVELSVTVTGSGHYGIATGSRTVTIPTTGTAVLTVATADDATEEPDGWVMVTARWTGCTAPTHECCTLSDSSLRTVTIRDNDGPPEVMISAAAASVTEGGTASFTLTADRAPDADLTVTLAVSEAAGSDYVVAADEGSQSVTIAKGTTEKTFSVATVDDAVDGPDGSVTVTLKDGAGYTLSNDGGYIGSPVGAVAATVSVLNKDTAAGPELSVADATVKEGEEVIWFTVRLSAPQERAVKVSLGTRKSTPVSAEPYRDYHPIIWTLPFRAGETEKRVWVHIKNDNHDEDPETFEVELFNPSGAPVAVGKGVAVGTIVNDDPMPAAWLARFGRAVAEQALDGIAARMAAPRTPGLQGTIAGQTLDFSGGADPGSLSPGPLSGAGFRSGGEAQSQGMTMQEVLRGSSFSLTGEADSAGGTLAFWGGTPGAGGLVSGSRFAGSERGGTAVSLSGETSAALLGTDYAQGPWLVGFALSQSRAEGSYAAIGGDVAARAGDGEVEASLTATIPYAALAVSERLKLWGAAGHGSGDVTVKTAPGGSYSADTAWSMAAAGLRGDLLAPPAEGTGPSLALVWDALWVRTSSEKTRNLAASESDVSRLRLGLEGSWGLALAGGGNIVPKLEFGARHDGGDAETGFGVELGGGLAWRDPGLGLTLDLSGRTLVAHDDGGLEDRGVSAQLSFDPEPASGRGLSFGLGQDWGGRAQGGLDALFTPEPLEDRTGGSEATARWAMEAAWGFPALGGRFTGSPHVGLGLATGARDYSFGWRLTPEAVNAPDLSFGLRATRRESDSARPEHVLGIEATARW